MNQSKKPFRLAAVGGTFDEFHKGHRALLEKAFEVGERVQIGLCSDDFAQKMKKPHDIAPFAVRLEELKSFLTRRGWIGRAEVVPLYDACGPAATSKRIEAIVVSRETESVAYAINEKRMANKFSPLEIVAIDMVLAENCSPISTTRIRLLEIDREGRLLRR
jgi:pantetheine-phosphate adenylyltransferase